MSRKKYSKQFERDYSFYLNNRKRFTFPGCWVRDQYKFTDDPNGKTAKECFFALDSRGELLHCSEIDLLYEIITCKMSLNMQIQMWAAGWAECTTSGIEMQETLDSYGDTPEWVMKAIVKQKYKLM